MLGLVFFKRLKSESESESGLGLELGYIKYIKLLIQYIKLSIQYTINWVAFEYLLLERRSFFTVEYLLVSTSYGTII